MQTEDYMNPDETDEMDFHVLGGNTKLVEAIVAKLPAGAVHLNSPVVSIAQKAGMVTVSTGRGNRLKSSLPTLASLPRLRR